MRTDAAVPPVCLVPRARRVFRAALACVAALIATVGIKSAEAQTTYTFNRASGNWTTASHWTPTRTTPAANDILVLDGTIAGSQTIATLPATQTIGRLRLINNVQATLTATAASTITITGGATPNLDILSGSGLTLSGSSAISLSLGASATANVVGAMTLQGGGHRLLAATAGAITFQSGSNFTTGTGFTGNAFGNTGTASIANFTSGSTYTHNAGSDPFGLAAPSSKVTFQTGSTATWRANTGFTPSGRTFYDLRVQNNTALSGSGTGNIVLHTLTVESGSSFTQASTSTASITITGDVTSAGSGNMSITAGSGGIQLNSGGTQTIGGGGGTGTVTFGSAATASTGTTVIVARNLAFTAGAMTVNGTFQINQGGGSSGPTNFTYGAGATLIFNNSSGSIGVSSGTTYWPAASGPTNVSVLGAGGITMNAGATRTISGVLETSGPITGANLLTLGGTVRMNAGGSMGASPTYTASSTLVYTAAFTVGNEWGAGVGVGVGVPQNVTIQGAGTVTMPSSDRSVPGNLTITTGTLALNATSGDLLVGGNWSNSGTLAPNGRRVTFTGSGTQTITRAAGETFATLALNKTGGSVQLLSNVTLAPASANGLEFSGTTDVLDLNGRQLTMTGAIGGSDPNGSLRGSTTSTLILNGTGAVGTLRFAAGGQSLGTWTVNRTGASAGVTLASPVTVSTTLNLTSGVVSTGTNDLTVASGGTLNRTTGHVFGRLGKNVPLGAAAVTYELGSATTYLPLNVTFGNVSTAGIVTGGIADGDHPNVATSGLNANKSVNRNYSLAGTGVVFNSYAATLRFEASDLDAGAIPDSFLVRRFTGGAWSVVSVTARTPTSVDIGGATALGDFAIGEAAPWIITSSSGPNGTISPLGPVEARTGTDVTFTMLPNQSYHLQDVLVDGGSVGPVSSYTFTNVTTNHTISVTFAINQYTLNVTTVGLGVVTRDINQATYPAGTFIVLTATPDLGWEFTVWSTDVNTAFNPVGFTVDSNMTVTGTFIRKSLAYTRTLFTGSYAPLSVATGATKLLSTADDSTRSVPLPFTFVYTGVPYTTANFLAVNANGFGFFSRTNVTASIASQSSNSNLFNSSAPNATLAPWYDDLTVGPIGTNPGGSVLYQLKDSPGAGRTLTVQWTNVSSFSSAASGQPRQLNFQLVLYENTSSIEFRYGSATGSNFSSLESASIGVEDTLGGNNLYIDAVTGSRLTNNGMMTSNKWPASFFRFTPGTPSPVPAGTYDVGLGQLYPGISQAVSDLNHRGISGPVTLQLRDAIYDTTAARGSTTFPILLGPVSGSSSVNTITILPASGNSFFRSRGTESGNCGTQLLTSAISSTNEPVFGVIGADYVTIRNVVFDGGLSADRGLLVMSSSNVDGAQNNLFENVTAQLQRANTSSIAIQQFVTNTPLTVAGTNSGNRYYNFTVANCFAGISISGNAGILDQNNEIGGGASRVGVVAGDIGNGPGQTFGIRAINQANLKIYGVDVRNITGTGTSPVDGISLENPSTLTLSNGVCEISGNTVHDLRSSNANGGRVTGIRVNLTASSGSSSRVYNNFVSNLSSTSTATSTRRIVGIFAQESGNGAGATHQIDFNSVRLAPAELGCSNTCFEIGTVSGPTMNVRNNVFANFSGTQTAGSKHYCWVTPSATAIGPGGSVSDRNVLHLSNLSNGFTGLAGGVDRVGLPEWQAVAGSDISSPTANPQFKGSSDLHVFTTIPTSVESNGSNFGGAITWVTNDFDGDLRNSATPDIGADEGNFQQLTTNDIASSAFVNPMAGGTVNVGVSFSPQATYDNSGLIAQSNVPVRYRIIGPLPATTIQYDQATTIGSLGVGLSQTVTFPSTSLGVGGIYTMAAISELPGDQNAANDTLRGPLDIAGPMSGTFSVGAAQPSPFNSITNAIARINSVGVSGPTTLQLVDAAYQAAETFPINVNSFPGASATNTLTLRPAPGVTATVTGSTTRALIVLNGCDFVVIDGSNTVGGTTQNLSFKNTSTNLGSAVLYAQTSTGGDPATNNTFKNLIANGNNGDQTLMVIGFGGPTIGLTSGGTGNNNNRVENCRLGTAQWGVFSSGLSAASKNLGTVVTNNQINGPAGTNVSRGGILIRFEDNVQLTLNRIENVSNTLGANAFGIALGLTAMNSGSIVGDEVTNATISQNRIIGITSPNVAAGVSAAGITVAPANSGTTTIVNNMIAGVLAPSLDPDFTAGILLGGGTATTRVWFNSINLFGDRGAAPGPSLPIAIGGTNPIVDLRNNVLANSVFGTGPGDTYGIGLGYLAPYTGLTSNFNVFFVTGPQFAVVGGLANTPDGDRTTFAAWRTETGKDANSVSGDPRFVSNTDLHIGQSGSAAANIGQPIAGVTVDVDGEAGSRTTTPDIGCDEFLTYPLTITVVNSGSVTKNPDAAQYLIGTVVQLTAVPAGGNHFVTWGGDLTGSANPASLTITGAHNVSATFALSAYNLTVAAHDSGTVTKNPDQPTYSYGAPVQLTATARPHYHFTAWGGDTTATTNPLNLVITRDRDLIADFVIDTHPVTVTVVGQGAVTKSPDLAAYPYGSTVQLTAVPNTGYRFINWGGDAGGGTNPIDVLVDGNKTISATFQINQYTLAVSALGNGTISKNPDQPTYPHGTVVVLTANPAVGHHFVGWGGDAVGLTNPISVTMDASKNITASFAINSYALNLTTLGDGSVVKNPNQPEYTHGTVVQLTATAGAGNAFLGWSGSASGSASPISVTMDSVKNITATFTYRIDAIAGANGSVSKSPNQANYAPGTVVQLTATPNTGFGFSGWTGSVVSTANPLSVTADANKTITANFGPNSYPLTVTSLGDGSVAKNPDQPTYTHGSIVQLTATAGSGNTFLGWSGDATGSTNPLSVTMNGPKNITATFSYKLDTAVIGSGTIARLPNQPNFAPGTVVQLTANPATGWHFVSWSGDATGTTNPVSVTVNANKSVTATFAINTYVLTVTTAGDGSVAKNPNQATYDHGTVVQLTATPGAGNVFIGWSGDATGSTNPLSVTMDRAKAITATFSYKLDVTTVGSGTVARNPNAPNYPPGTVVQLTATPTTGWSFVGWSGDATGSTNPVSVTISANRSVTATFTINSYPLTVTTLAGDGSVSKNPDQPSYTHGTVVQLTANPGAGNALFAWGGDASGSTSPLPVTVDGPKTITATFTYKVTTTVVGSGTVAKNPNQPNFAPGTVVQLTATPATGWSFVGWSGDATGSTNPVSVTADANRNVTATFQINTYLLVVSTVGDGSVAKNPNQATYNHGTVVQLTATPGTGNVFLGWSGDATGTTNPISVTMDGPKGITATFTYKLDVVLVGSGTVLKSPNQPNYTPGTVVQLTATPTTGWTFTGWSGDATGTGNPVSVTVDANRSVTATFAINTYPLTMTTLGDGNVGVNPNLPAYNHGTVVQLTATPGAGNVFFGWSGDASGTTSPLSVTMDAAKSITATFSYRVTVTTSGNGTVTRDPDLTHYAPDTIVFFTAVPAAGWHFTNWSGANSSTTNPLPLQITANLTLNATFVINQYTLGLPPWGAGTVAASPSQPTYPHGATVQLTATPNPGHTFLFWAGDTTGTTNPITVPMTRSKTIRAHFTNRFTANAVGGGSVTVNPVKTAYQPGDTVNVTGTPSAGNQFNGWTGDVSTLFNPIRVIVDSNMVATANFIVAPNPVITTTIVGTGSVTKNPNQANYPVGSFVTLTAVAGAQYHFLSWSGDVVATGNPISVWMDRDKNITVRFVPNSVVLTTPASSGGTVARSPDQPSYAYGAVVQLTATPDAGNRFVGWSGDATGSTNPLSVTMNGDKTITAQFGPTVGTPPPARPDRFALFPPMPNPARASVGIEFALPDASPVRLAIVDLQGREIARVAEGAYPVGRHRATWDGRAAGKPAPPGLYFFRLRAGGQEFVQRVVLAR